MKKTVVTLLLSLASLLAQSLGPGVGVGPILQGFNVNATPFNADPTGVLDSTAAFTAACVAAAANGGVVQIPAGTYLIDNFMLSCAGAKGVLIQGVPGATWIIDSVALSPSTGHGGYAFQGIACVSSCNNNGNTLPAQAGYSNVRIDGINFLGNVQVPSGCTAGPNYTVTACTLASPVQSSKIGLGTGLQWGIYIAGSLDTVDTGQPFNVVANITITHCGFYNIANAPLKSIGVTGQVVWEDNVFFNGADPGAIYNQSLLVTNNWSWISGDAGFSFTRGNTYSYISGNHVFWSNQACYGLEGYIGYVGSTRTVLTGNEAIGCGNQGVWVDFGPPNQVVISNNYIDKQGIRGAQGAPTDSNQQGILLRTTSGNMNHVQVNGNQIYNGTQTGIALTNNCASGTCGGSLQDIQIHDNLIADLGTQYLANGTTAIGNTDTANIGIFLDTYAGYSFYNVDISNNSIADLRSTPYMNYSICAAPNGATAGSCSSTMPSGVTATNNTVKAGRGGF